ncbi:MAG: ArsR/SmtB family transcription factor [Lachnospiraceae bacterium]
MDNKRMAAMFKAFADENRIQILELLRDGERCACRLLEEMKITQPTLSHHMKILCDSGIVVGRKEGKWMHYSISEDGMRDVRNYLDELMKYTKMGDDSQKSCH